MQNDPIHVRPGSAREDLDYLMATWGEDTSTVIRRAVREAAAAERTRQFALVPRRFVAGLRQPDAEINFLNSGGLAELQPAQIAEEITAAIKRAPRFEPQG